MDEARALVVVFVLEVFGLGPVPLVWLVWLVWGLDGVGGAASEGS